MGFFSWKTSEGTSIPNRFSERSTFPVFMVLPPDKDGNSRRYREDDYEGYGVFGGVDFYAALDYLNRPEEEQADMKPEDGDRLAGISLYYDKESKGKIMPRLTEKPDAKWEDLKDPEDCEYQGYFYNF